MTSASTTQTSDATASLAPLWRAMMATIALAALAVAVYLLVVSAGQMGAPLGCGPESGCAAVLGSRWSTVLGVPVAAPAIALYLAALLAVLMLGRSATLGRQRAAWSLLLFCSVCIVVAAAWFIYLQLFQLKALCPWCMTEHALGLLLAGLALWLAPVGTVQAPTGRSTSMLALGVVAGALFIATQWLVPPQSVRRLANDSIITSETDEQILALGEAIEFQIANTPHYGSLDAERSLLLFYDYCCPHCRAAHAHLLAALARYPGQLLLLLWPTPMNSECNEHLLHTDKRFETACDLAKLALAVWHADAGRFAEFDRWLYAPELPRSSAEAKAEAERLVGADALRSALASGWPEAQIKRNTDAFAHSGATSLPLLDSPGMSPVEGRHRTQAELFELLETELGLEPTVSRDSAPSTEPREP